MLVIGQDQVQHIVAYSLIQYKNRKMSENSQQNNNQPTHHQQPQNNQYPQLNDTDEPKVDGSNGNQTFKYSDEQYQKDHQCYQSDQPQMQYPHHPWPHNQCYPANQYGPYAQPTCWNAYPQKSHQAGWQMSPFQGHQNGWHQQFYYSHHGFNPHHRNFQYHPFQNQWANFPQQEEQTAMFPGHHPQKHKRSNPNQGYWHGYGKEVKKIKCNELKKRKNSTSSQSKNKSKSKSKGKHSKHHGKHHHQKSKNKVEQKHSQSSSSQNELNEVQEKMNKLSIENTKLKQSFNQCLTPFFEKYHVPNKTQHKIFEFLMRRCSKVEELDPLVSMLYGLEVEGPELLQSHYYGLFAVVKQIFKKNFEIDLIIKALKKKEELRKKKETHDSKFKEKYPNPIEVQFLQRDDLLQLDTTKTLFLIDGNNIMQRQKHFRSYFEDKSDKKKAEGQIRLRWLAYEARIKAEIFFDIKYPQNIYENINKYLFSPQEEANIAAVPVHYAEKELNQDNTADQRLVDRLSEIVENECYDDHEIVLVSADKELCQICSAIFPVKKTSGLYIFKYCKKLIKERCGDQPELKKVIKQIFKY